MAMGLVAAYFLARRVTRPLRELAQAAVRITTGDYETTVTVKSADEFGILSANFNEMTEAIRIRRVADATAESIQKVNQAIQAGGEAYFRYRQIEMLPQIAPAIAEALAEAKMVTISSGEVGAPETTSNNITSVVQTVLAAQMVAKTGILDQGEGKKKP